jgi:predicted nuclease with RNAse H fold
LITTIGIDVGAPTKGFHAIALCGSTIAAKHHSRDANDVARWCGDRLPQVVAIDAPCRWRVHGQPARAAERALAAYRVSCFSTPTEEKARGHAFYTWMFAGHALYAALAERYPIYDKQLSAISGQASGISGLSAFNLQPSTRVAIETYPHAVACALAGGHVSAKQKFANRTALLRAAGIDPSPLRNIDEVDAALCALAAQHFVAGTFKAYGDDAGGYIIVRAIHCREPLTSARRPRSRLSRRRNSRR